jgi:hypothetical protein
MINPLYNSIVNIKINYKIMSTCSDKELQEELENMIALLQEYNKPLDLCNEDEISKMEDIQLYILEIDREINDRRMRDWYNR